MLGEEEARILAYTRPADLHRDKAFWDRERELLGGAILLLLLGIANEAVDEYAGYFQDEFSFGIDVTSVQAEAADWAKKYSYELVKDLTNTTRNNLQANVGAWIASGSTELGDLQKLIAPAFGDVRALRIAQTEVTRAWSEGREALWRESGVVERKRWSMAVGMPNICEVCQDLHGKITKVGEPYPGYPNIFKPPDPHPGCRCSEMPVLDFGLLKALPIVIDGAVLKGGPGSGHRGHRGVPGFRGGSMPSSWAGYAGSVPGADAGELGVRGRKVFQGELVRKLGERFYPDDVTMIKDEIATKLSETTGLPYDDCDKFVRQWATSSNDADYQSLSIQEAAAEMFGVKMSDWQKGQIKEAGRIAASLRSEGLGTVNDHHIFEGHADPKGDAQRVLGAMYGNTQEMFRKGSVDKVVLYRGVTLSQKQFGGLGKGDTVPIKLNSLSSWSLSQRTATLFAGESEQKVGIVFSMEIPVKRVAATARTGFGCLNEWECVVVGGIEGDNARIERVYK